jgi:hypothetical protein
VVIAPCKAVDQGKTGVDCLPPSVRRQAIQIAGTCFQLFVDQPDPETTGDVKTGIVEAITWLRVGSGSPPIQRLNSTYL